MRRTTCALKSGLADNIDVVVLLVVVHDGARQDVPEAVAIAVAHRKDPSVVSESC